MSRIISEGHSRVADHQRYVWVPRAAQARVQAALKHQPRVVKLARGGASQEGSEVNMAGNRPNPPVIRTIVVRTFPMAEYSLARLWTVVTVWKCSKPSWLSKPWGVGYSNNEV